LTWEETDDGIGLLRASSGDHQHQKGYYCEEDDEDQPAMKAAVVVDGVKPDDGTASRTRLVVAKKEVLHSQGW
jgi:hypothetical protein